MNNSKVDLNVIAENLCPEKSTYAALFGNQETAQKTEEGMTLVHALDRAMAQESDQTKRVAINVKMLETLCEVYSSELKQGTRLMGWIIGSLIKQMSSAGISPIFPDEFMPWLNRYKGK